MHPRRFRPLALLVALALGAALVACDGGGDGGSPSTSTPPPPLTPAGSSSVTPSVTPPALPDRPPPRRGEASPECVNGWVAPKEGSPAYLQPLGIVRRTTEVRGPLTVVDMRYFQGPESPPSDKGYLLVVERWYIKLFAEREPAFQGRFLIEARRFGRGLVAVAAYDTEGFSSPDWVAFQYDSADTDTRSYPGLPGQWSGVPYDFVRGGGGPETPGPGIPGLPDEVVGCLDGT
ncbi:MAG TPA: hypothetical protein VFR44_02580 [Actinomycetota bacterium]|nr:hypothetical protein [Actinomycetota bacterium]